MIKIEFSDEDKAALSYERYNHPHPFVQRKMEALWLKSQGLAHKDIRRLTNVCSTTLTDYVRDYRAGLGCLNSFPRMISGVPLGLVVRRRKISGRCRQRRRRRMEVSLIGCHSV